MSPRQTKVGLNQKVDINFSDLKSLKVLMAWHQFMNCPEMLQPDVLCAAEIVQRNLCLDQSEIVGLIFLSFSQLVQVRNVLF